MESPLITLTNNLDYLHEHLTNIVNQTGENSLHRGEREAISQFNLNHKNFIRFTAGPLTDIEDAIISAKAAAINAKTLGEGVGSNYIYDTTTRSAAKELQVAAIDLINIFDNGDEFSLENLSPKNTLSGPVSNHEKEIIELKAKIRSEIKSFQRDITNGTDEIEKIKQKSASNYERSSDEVSELLRTVEHLKANISSLHECMTTESNKAAKISEDAAEHSKVVHSKIDELLGQTASKVLLVDYANTAEAEKNSADSMRNWSLVCMALTGGILCFALYESLGSAFDWKQSVLKVFTAIALSVPAAYLARESAKHRSQEHTNRRISLDLRAITPYIATLPSEEQNKIKSEVASKIFGVQENGNVPLENYPINIQELVKSIIDKIPTSK